MNKILNSLNKYLKKYYLLGPLLYYQKDNLIIIVIILLLFYLNSNSKLFKKFGVKINKNINNASNIIFNNDNKEDILNLNTIDLSKKNEDKDNTKSPLFNEENNIDKIPSVENKENIKVNIDKVNRKKNNKSTSNNMEFTPYVNNRKIIKKNYSDKPEKYDFSVNVNSSVCSIPIFNLRTYNEIDFYFNFVIHNYDSKKIHNLILCKDIHKWMNNSTLSDQDISNELVPVYFILKKNEKVDVYEYLKIFIHNGEDGKIAFIQKGNDYLIIDKYTNELIEKEIIKDLLDGRMYTSYNLYSNEGVNEFLNNFLSLVLISENSIGNEIQLDIENYHENKSSYEYFFNTINTDTSLFNTTI
jgi:hypothetical protein